jgi:hypothetical protein
MGLFSLLNDLTDPDKLSGAIDKVEQTLSHTLDKAEGGIQTASNAVEKLETVAQRAEEKIQVVDDMSTKAIDGIKRVG